MTKLSKLMLGALLILGFSCTPKTASEISKTNSETTSNAEAVSFTTKVLNGDIPSPRKEMTATVGGAAVVINYGSPSAKGRDLWGGLVKYGKVWRLGANEATTFEVKQAVTVEGKSLAAGKYGLFVIPGEDRWEVIFNAEAEQWGAYKYNEGKDVLRVSVAPEQVAEFSETMEFMTKGNEVVFPMGENGRSIYCSW